MRLSAQDRPAVPAAEQRRRDWATKQAADRRAAIVLLKRDIPGHILTELMELVGRAGPDLDRRDARKLKRLIDTSGYEATMTAHRGHHGWPREIPSTKAVAEAIAGLADDHRLLVEGINAIWNQKRETWQ